MKRKKKRVRANFCLGPLVESGKPFALTASMDTQQLLRAAIVAIVLVGALVLLGVLLNLAIPLLGWLLKLLLVGLLVVMLLRFVALWAENRR